MNMMLLSVAARLDSKGESQLINSSNSDFWGKRTGKCSPRLGYLSCIRCLRSVKDPPGLNVSPHLFSRKLSGFARYL